MTTGTAPGLVRSMRRPGLVRLGLAGLLSETGDWVLLIASPIYVLQLTGSASVSPCWDRSSSRRGTP